MSSPGDNRDAGFCSGEDEDLDVDHVDTDADNSPTDVSEDSVDVKVHVIGGIKRKHAPHHHPEPPHPKKPCRTPESSHLKARSPFRPWSHESSPRPLSLDLPQSFPVPCGYIPPNYRSTPTEQNEPLELVTKKLNQDRIYKPKYAGTLGALRTTSPERVVPKLEPIFTPLLRPPEFTGIAPGDPFTSLHRSSPLCSSSIPKESISVSPRDDIVPTNRSLPGLSLKDSIPDVRVPSLSSLGVVPEDSIPSTSFGVVPGIHSSRVQDSNRSGPPKLRIKQERRDAILEDEPNPAFRGVTVKQEPETDEPDLEPKTKKCKSSQQQRNYKNMTRERRMEANARERTRVHTISAAFETLRHSVPAYSHNQKLSKLSVLRIACSYIMTLSRLAGLDYSSDQSQPPIASCVDNVSKTIQMEGKLRKKKDD